MKSYFNAFQRKKYKKQLKKFITELMVPINQDPSFGIDTEDLDITWPKMMLGAIAYARKCTSCQLHVNFIY